jgi:GntR family transcriptional regulator, transcriptional repressor for pyruvate dehydrogenase complex
MLLVCRASPDSMNAHFDKIKKVPAYRILAEAIIEQILDGRLREGDQLPTEAKLCEMFGVNRSTVREGIRALEEAKLLRREHAKKMVISRPSDQDVGKQFERALILQEVGFQEIWESMTIFEPPMAGLAAQRGDASGVERLEANLRATESALQEGRSVVELDIEFHAMIASMSANRALILAREPISRLFYPYFQVVMTRVPTAGERLLKAHRVIVDSIRKGNAAEAQEWMRKHVQDFRRGARLAELDVGSPPFAAGEGHRARPAGSAPGVSKEGA